MLDENEEFEFRLRQEREATIPVPSQKTKQPLSKRVAESMQQTPEQARQAEVLWNAAKGAVPAVADMFLNAPVNALNLGNAAFGTIANMAGKPDLAPPLKQQPNYAQRLSEKLGFTNQQADPQTTGEGYLAAAAQGATAGIPAGVPGMALGALSGVVGQGVTQLTGDPAYGTLAGAAVYPAANAAGKFGKNQLAAAELRKAEKVPQIEMLDKLHSAGYVIPPTTTNPTFVNRVLEGVGGKAATAQEASIRGDAITQRLIRDQLGIPKGIPLTDETLSTLANVKAQPYRDVSALPEVPPARYSTRLNPMRGAYPLIGTSPPKAELLLKDLRDARLDAKADWKKFSVAGGASERAAYEASAARVAKLEAGIEQAAANAGRSDLIPQLQQARKDIAQIHDVGRALNTDTGSVSATDLARARNRGVPLSGNLLLAAQMGENYPQAIRDPSRVGSPAVNALISGLSAAAGGVIGAGAGGGAGAAGGAGMGAVLGPMAVQGTQGAMRNLILSKLWQEKMGTPNYDASVVSRGLANAPLTNMTPAAIRAYLLSQQLEGQQP